MIPLKQSTEVTILFGEFVDKADGVTAEVGLAGNATEISKMGAAFGAGPVLGTHDSDGWYPITLTTTHTNTIGELIIKSVDDAVHLPVSKHYWVFAANVYDSLFGAATDKLQVDTVEVTGTAQTAGDLAALIAVVDGVADAILVDTGTTLQAELDGIQAKTDNLPSDPADQSLIIAATDAVMNRLGAPAGASMSADIAAVKSNTADILTDTGTTLQAELDGIQADTEDIQAKIGTPAADLAADIAAVPTATENADELLKRDWTSVTGEAARSVLNALRHIRNRWFISGTTLTITEEDDTTPAWTAVVTPDATADPITGTDPT